MNIQRVIPDDGGPLNFYYSNQTSAYSAAKNLIQLMVERLGCVDQTEMFGWKSTDDNRDAVPLRFYNRNGEFVGEDFIGIIEQTKTAWICYMEPAVVLDVGDNEYYKIFLTHLFYNGSFVCKFIGERLKHVSSS